MRLIQRQQTLDCDVLVVGGGGAGLRAAIAARLKNADTLLVSKTRIGHATNTYISKAVIAASGWKKSDDDPTVHAADTLRGGRFLNDPSLVSKMTERAGGEIAFLKDCGVRFGMEDGALRVIRTPGHRHARHVHGENWVGSGLVAPLKRFAGGIGVRFGEQIFVTRLLAAGGRIAGAAGITADGTFITIRAGSVILATGGYAQIFLNNNNAAGITGDGQALAFHAGVPLKDMEFVQFYPTALGKRGNRIFLYERVLACDGAVLRNRDGADIIAKHGVSDLMGVTRDQLAQWVMQEIAGNPTGHAQVMMDLDRLPTHLAERLKPVLPPAWWKGQKTFAVAPTAHFCMGGVVVDENGETRLGGLFAVGEIAAGIHGANRLGGNALAEIFAMGSWVGGKAAGRAMKTGRVALPREMTENEAHRLEHAFSPKGVNVNRLVQALKAVMWRQAGILRRKPQLEAALTRIREPWDRPAAASAADLIRCLTFDNMRLVAEMVCRAALARKESRGAHFRSDYPAEDNGRWLKNIFLQEKAGKMHLSPKPVPSAPNAGAVEARP